MVVGGGMVVVGGTVVVDGGIVVVDGGLVVVGYGVVGGGVVVVDGGVDVGDTVTLGVVEPEPVVEPVVDDPLVLLLVAANVVEAIEVVDAAVVVAA